MDTNKLIDNVLDSIHEIVTNTDRPPASEMAAEFRKRVRDDGINLNEFLCWFDEEE